MKAFSPSHVFAALCLLTATFGATGAQAGIIGDTVSLKGQYPDIGTVDGDYGTAVVASGKEFNPGPTDPFSVDFDTSTITFMQGPLTETIYYPATFNGFVFADLTTPFSFASLNATTVAGLTSSDIFLQNGMIYLNLQNLDLEHGNTIVINVATGTTASVPEPLTLSLFAAGLIGAGTVRRRKAKA